MDQVQGAASKVEEAVGDMGITLGGLNGGMSEEDLNDPDIVTAF